MRDAITAISTRGPSSYCSRGAAKIIPTSCTSENGSATPSRSRHWCHLTARRVMVEALGRTSDSASEPRGPETELSPARCGGTATPRTLSRRWRKKDKGVYPAVIVQLARHMSSIPKDLRGFHEEVS